MVRLGIDLGSVRIGIAISDELGMIASPLKVMQVSEDETDIAEIASIVESLDVKEIVMGLPRNMNGTYGPAADRVKEFASKLEEKLDVPITLWDERLTTSQASRILIEADVSRKKRKQVVDKSAAALILQGYLDRTNI